LLALETFGVAVVVTLEAAAFARGRGSSHTPRSLGWLSLALLPAGLGEVVTGVFVTAAGPHPGSLDVPRLGNVADAAYVHVRATAVFGIGFAILVAALIRRRREARAELRLAASVLVLLLVQMALGEYQWRSGVPSGAVLAHVALAALVWGGLVALAIRLVWAAGLTRSAATGRALPVPRLP
jgi:cytochrome c oxidase assembly protein subunit 15